MNPPKRRKVSHKEERPAQNESASESESNASRESSPSQDGSNEQQDAAPKSFKELVSDPSLNSPKGAFLQSLRASPTPSAKPAQR